MINYFDLVTVNERGQQIAHEVTPCYGIRDEHLLQSIPNSIYQTIFGQEIYPSVFDKSAYLWEALCNFHCFYNGNKRTALLSTLVHLKLSGYECSATKDMLFDMSLRIASGTMTREDIKKFIDQNWEENMSPDFIVASDCLDYLLENETIISVVRSLAKT